MYSNKIAVLVGAIAAIEQASALNLHRHEHKLQKKDEAVVWETIYETVFVTEGAPAPQVTVHVNANTVTSQQVVVVPTPQPKVEPPVVQALAPAPTTSLVTSVKPAPTSAPTGSGNSGNTSGPGFSHKRGLAYTDGTLANLFGSSSSGCGWGYNWGQTAGGLDSKYSFVPTLWGNKDDFLSTWDSNVNTALSSGSKALFSFNEPDNKGQSNMSPDQAASMFVKYMNPYSGKALIGAPSVTNSNLAGEGLDWLTSFVSSCQSAGCKYDFCNVHWYSPVSQYDDLFAHIEKAHKICGKPIWLTEFAPIDGSTSDVNAFVSKAIPQLDSLDYLTAYSYFMVRADSLMSSATSLSPVGQAYASA